MNKHTNKRDVDKHNSLAEKKAAPPYLKYGIISFAAVVVIAIALIIYISISKSFVATVGGEKIGTGEFKYYLDYQKSVMLQEAQKVDPNTNEDAFWKTNIGGDNAFEVAKKKTLDTLQDLKIQLIKAKEAKTKLSTQETKYIDDRIKDIVNEYGSNIKANTALKKEGLSLDVFRKMYENILIAQKYRDAELEKIKVADADIKTYYDKNPDWYKENDDLRTSGEEAVWARHILINVAQDATQETKDAARKKAQEILDKAKAGEDFAKLAKEFSEDPGSKDTGGEYIFGRGRMVKEFEDTAFALKPGEISGLVETNFGYHIIKLEEKYAKDEPVSLRCATEYNEYGVMFIKYKLYTEKLNGWKKEARFDIKKNLPVYNAIKS